MSFLSRLAARARPSGAASPLLMPKGFAARQAAIVHREDAAAEEQEVAPKRALRREQPPAPEEGEAELPRAAASDQAEEEQPADEMRPLRRAADTESEPGDKDEEARPLRRAAAAETEPAEPEEEARALRRAAAPEAEPETENEEAVQPARLIRRAEEVPLDNADRPLRQPFQSDLQTGATPPHPDLAAEEEPSSLQALRRDAIPQLPAHGEPRGTGEAAQGSVFGDDASAFIPGLRDRTEGIGAAAYFETGHHGDVESPGAAGASVEPSPVIIDQLDVVIHEPAPPASAARAGADHGRMLRARYLRRL